MISVFSRLIPSRRNCRLQELREPGPVPERVQEPEQELQARVPEQVLQQALQKPVQVYRS